MNLDDLNKISSEAKDLDREREMLKSARSLVQSVVGESDSLVEQLRRKNSWLNDERSGISGRQKVVIDMVEDYIESIRSDMMGAIESKLLAKEKHLLSRASMKRQRITAAIVGKPVVDGGE